MSVSVQMGDREQAICLLAGSRDDFMAGPSQGKSPSSSRRERGRPAPSVKVLCLTCDGDKLVKDKFGREQPCPDCESRGWHKVDPMMETQVTKWSDPPTSSFTRRALCDRCAGEGVWKGKRCPNCDGAGRVSVPIHRDVGSPKRAVETETITLPDGQNVVVRDLADASLSPIERGIVNRNKLGSYHEFDVAVAKLDPHRARIFVAVYVARTQSLGLLSGTESDLLRQAMLDLLRLMPRVIWVPREVVLADRREPQDAPKGRLAGAEALAERDREIRVRFKRGHGEKARELAKAYGLSVARVNEIVYQEREVA